MLFALHSWYCRVLRSCNISGKISSYISEMASLKTLDLSFNKLDGEIPNLGSLSNLESMFLTSNLLSGTIPEWILGREGASYIDLSYNNFSGSSALQCLRTINLFRSFSERKNLEPNNCFSPCSHDWYAFHINCGGKQVRVGNTIFDEDEESGGSAKFVSSKENWGTSSTGEFLDAARSSTGFTGKNISILQMNDPELYMTARLSPLSMAYFGRCLANGDYTVKLYFAEIIFRDDESFGSLGRRIFDIYIQDELVWKDFNIKSLAGGVNKALEKSFKTVVTNKTLEIRFQWAGKGTTIVPTKGNYGSLVSAISVKSNFDPSSGRRKKIIGAVVAVTSLSCVALILLFVFWRKGYFRRASREEVLRGLDLQAGLFTFKQIKSATNNFAFENKIGEGGFGSVYKGILLDGTTIAVKQLSSKSKQGSREFVNEVGIISALHHPNLVKLYGCCVGGNQLLLVYEYMVNNSLARSLYGPEEWQLNLDWPTRQRICIGIARGLAFLHEESTLKVVHRDIKANNILLDRDLNPKISDFGLAKLDEERNTHISTRVAGTIGYMAPEYALWGHLTYKADVYSFGVVALEIVAGRNNMSRPDGDYVCLLDWALVLQKRGDLLEVVDPRLGSNFDKKTATEMIKVALLCTHPSPDLRPTMSSVVAMLEGRVNIQESNIDPSIYEAELKFKALRDKYELQPKNSTESTNRLHSSDLALTASTSTSGQDPSTSSV